MGVRRNVLAFEKDFTQIPNGWLRDARLSRKARGLLAEIMTHSAGWHVTLRGLVAAGPEGRDAVVAAMGELRDAGYLVLLDQGHGEGGRFAEREYELRDPFTAPGFSGPGSAAPGSTAPGKSDPIRTPVEEHHLEEDQHSASQSGAADFELDLPAGTRARLPLPNPFLLTATMEAWAAGTVPSLNVRAVTAEFVAYWRVGEGAGRGKKNWQLAWRNWLKAEHARNVERGWKPAERKSSVRSGRIVR